ncbi:hypothetical protein TWF569_000034 [Orbilia oligospora]|uniref:Major facilitator superfamily (MFS) profile domain-containing protein n=1 Tax=Orbilia oligospora TaxID=2813651 RepID=A0A7C8JM36_ORBOL|nr:hypothetical protein TWF102_000703 [Orbilia oligospora]KAF3087313.1 hypothetical protein TWF706_011177 [Orbilia oligospora]KAF3103624.1 hypothetical protein TWF103_007139 [Orbilia oligospora]KAF3132458.1 hypothetical protein TWF703_007254 [Orbilia oligospora]KAF3142624.1 hypothetical protein TWF594_005509 [Orbilia oligospora]
MASYIDIHKERPSRPEESEPLNAFSPSSSQSSSSSPANSRPGTPRPPPLSPLNPRTPLEPFEIMDTPLLDTHPHSPPTVYTSRHRRTVLLCILLEVFIIFSFATTSLPFTRIVENSVCQRWYEFENKNQTLIDEGRKGGGGFMPDEKLCKTDEIQAGVVEILGVSDTISTVVSLLVMFPSGFLAGVIDRRAFLLLAIGETAVGLSLMGFIGSNPLAFDPRLFWVIPLFDLIGGGFTFFGIMMRTVIAENTPKDDLAAVYYKLTGFNILSTFLGTTLGSWLMGIISPVKVLYMGVVLFVVLSVPTILLLPPALPEKEKNMYDDIRSSQYPETADDNDADDEDTTAAPRRKATLYQRFLEQARSKTNLYASVKTLLFEQRAIRNALVILFLNMIARGVRIPFQTWVSKRYSWTLSKTGIVLSFESLMGAVVLLLLPFAKSKIERVVSGKGSLWRKLRFPPDLMIATLSLVAQTLSAILLTVTASEFFLVMSLVVNAPARAFFDGLRSHCIAQAKESEIMIIHMAFVIVEIMSGILNGPLWIKVYAFTYSEGNVTGLGMGLPFAICAVLTGGIVAGMGWARGNPKF